MAWVTPVYDRIQSDVSNKTAKGFMNAADFNRIEGNLEILAEMTGFAFSSVSWDVSGYPTTADYDRYITALTLIREFASFTTTPEMPELPINTWQKWNAIEKIMADAYKIHSDAADAVIYAGEIYAGEIIGVM